MLTFEKIRDMERVEKSGKNLQKLPENFMNDIKEYLTIKKDLLESENARNAVKKLVEIREQKIMNLALYSARTGMPVENLTETEKEFFNQIKELAHGLRESLLSNLNENYAIVPNITKTTEVKEIKNKKEDKFIKENKNKFKVVKEIPEFLGPDMKTYNLVKGETIDLPDELAELLVKNGVVERV